MGRAAQKYVEDGTDLRRRILHPVGVEVVQYGDPRVHTAGSAAGAALAVATRRAALGGADLALDGRNCTCGWWFCSTTTGAQRDELGKSLTALDRAKVDPWCAGVVDVAEWYCRADAAVADFEDLDRLRRAIARLKVTGRAGELRRDWLAQINGDWTTGAVATRPWQAHRGTQERREVDVALYTAREHGWNRNTPAVVAAILILTGVCPNQEHAGFANRIHSIDQQRKRHRPAKKSRLGTQ